MRAPLCVAAGVLVLTACGGTATPTATPAPTAPTSTQQGCSRTSVGLTPLSDVSGAAYQGQPLGLYPGGTNFVPSAHLADGVSLARAVTAMDAQGRPSSSGRYAFVSIGMSNTTQEFSVFKPMADADPSKDPQLVIVDGAQGGQTATNWANPGCACWTELDRRITAAGLTNAQVATAWIKLADAAPSEGWPAHAQRLRDEQGVILEALASRFPNLRLAYFSSRIYAGYATSSLNPEPYSYQSAFAIRWLIESQVNGTALRYTGASRTSPWIAWGPYLWADGLTPRSDGLTWACSDFSADDGTHPATSGRQKVADRLLSFVKTDPTAREWFLR